MTRDLTQALEHWIAAGGRDIGEIHLDPTDEGFVLCHQADQSRPDLNEHLGPEKARDLSHFDTAGKFRPLKTAPNLQRGWKLRVADLADLRRALDYFYPAMLGVWLSHRQGTLHPLPLRDTLARQTGMYAVTKKITDDQAQSMIASFCRTDGGCLKRILWPIAPEVPVTSLPAEKFRTTAPSNELPLLCHEACNLLVAQARSVVKKAETTA
jgi:sirohydrochlorin cobaltochelatase